MNQKNEGVTSTKGLCRGGMMALIAFLLIMTSSCSRMSKHSHSLIKDDIGLGQVSNSGEERLSQDTTSNQEYLQPTMWSRFIAPTISWSGSQCYQVAQWSGNKLYEVVTSPQYSKSRRKIIDATLKGVAVTCVLSLPPAMLGITTGGIGYFACTSAYNATAFGLYDYLFS